VSVRFLGWPFALARLLAAPLAAIAAALLVASTTRRTARASEAYADDAALRELTDHGAHRSFGAHARAHFDELLFHTGAWTLVGLLVASYVEIALPAASLAHLARHGLDVVLVAAAALPSYFCASSAAPLAAVLVAKGLSPGGALVGLVLAPAMNVATIAFLARTFGRRARLRRDGGPGRRRRGRRAHRERGRTALAGGGRQLRSAARHGPVSFAALALFGLLIARGVWQSGLRAWLASLEDAFAAPRSGPLPVGPHVHELRESEAAAAAEEHRHQATDLSAGR
jgi:hypothetical protein